MKKIQDEKNKHWISNRDVKAIDARMICMSMIVGRLR
jgi:hypothetical protein